MTAETSVAAAPARPARSLTAVATFPGQRRVRPPGSERRGLPEPSRGLAEAAREPIKLGRRVDRSDGTAAPAGRPCRDDCGGLWLFVSAMLDAVSGGIVIALFIVVPLIAVTTADEHRTALVAGLTVVLTIAAGAGTATGRMRATGPGSRRPAP